MRPTTRKSTLKPRLSRETLLRLGSGQPWFNEPEGGTDTCAGSGCPEFCATWHGPNCHGEAPEKPGEPKAPGFA